MYNSDKDLYGYNTSTQINFHIQSYLFGIKPTSLNILNKHFKNIKNEIKDYHTLVLNMELKLCDIYKDYGYYLPTHIVNDKLNIYFNNDILYSQLLKNNILPFLKLKRIIIKI